MSKYYKFYACCKIVRGAGRTTVYDLQRCSFFHFPNMIMEVLLEYETKGLEALCRDYNTQKQELHKYLQYLLNNEIIFYTDDIDNYPDISLDIDKPFYLDFISIEVDTLQNFKIDFLEKSIDYTGVEHIVFIFNTNRNSINNITQLLKAINTSRLKVVTLILPYNEMLIEGLNELKRYNERLKQIILYNKSDAISISKLTDYNAEIFNGSLHKLLTKKIKSEKDFTLNIMSFLEAQNKNLFFNRRVYISDDGNVKPSFVDNNYYGTIEYDSLFDIVNKKGFQRIWNITKDQIEVCKNCEFRYMCPDNRIPIKNNNKYIHTTECNYNPFTTQWKSNVSESIVE